MVAILLTGPVLSAVANTYVWGSEFTMSFAVTVFVAVITILVVLFFGLWKFKYKALPNQNEAPRRYRFRKRDKVLFFGRKMLRKVKSFTRNTVGPVAVGGMRRKPSHKLMISRLRRFLAHRKESVSKPRLKQQSPPQSFLEADWSDLDDDHRLPPEVLYMLRSVRVFGHLEKPFFLELCRYMESITLRGGHFLFKVGDPDDSIYVVQSGLLEVYITDSDGTEHLVKQVATGNSIHSLLSILDVLTGHPGTFRSVSARAVTDSTILRLPAHAFKSMFEKFNESAVKVVQIIMIRLQRVTFSALHNYLGLSKELLKPVSPDGQGDAKELNIHRINKATNSPIAGSPVKIIGAPVLGPEIGKEETDGKGSLGTPSHRKLASSNSVGSKPLGELGSQMSDFDAALMRARASISDEKSIVLSGSPPRKFSVSEHTSEISASLSYRSRTLPDEDIILSMAAKDLVQILGLKDPTLLEDRLSLSYVRMGSVFCKQGDQDTSLFFLVKGTVSVLQNVVGESSKEALMFHAEPGEIIDVLAVLTGEPSLFTMRAKSDAVMVVISKPEFYQIMRVEPFIVLNVAHCTVKRMSNFVRQIDFALDWQMLESGKALFRQGDPSESIFIVLTGRLRSVLTTLGGKKELVGEFGRGELVGIVEVLTQNERATTVLAIRDTELTKIPAELLNLIKLRYPQVVARLIHLLGTRILGSIQQRNTVTVPFRSDSFEKMERTTVDNLATIAIIPVTEDVPLTNFVLELQHQLLAIGPTVRLTPDIVKARLGTAALEGVNEFRLFNWLSQQEDIHRIVLYQCDYQLTKWSKHSLRQADCILIVGLADKEPTIGPIERELESIAVRAQKELILLHKEDAETPRNTTEWLNVRGWLSSHHHICCPKRIMKARSASKTLEIYERLFETKPDRMSDFARLARFLTGTSIGLVLGGGGARGLAHVGMIRAMQEAGIPIDMVGGTSMGSFIGALWAEERNFVQFTQRAREWAMGMTSLWKKIWDLTYPVASMFTGWAFNESIENVFHDRQIEDLWIPYFCITTNISNSSMRVHSLGSVWRYVRASMSLSGYLPPLCDPADGHLLLDGGYVNNLPGSLWHYVRGSMSIHPYLPPLCDPNDGHLLLDGAYVNNVPADVMHNLGAKFVFAVDVGSQDETDLTNYGDCLSGWWLLWKRWNPWAKPVRVPDMTEIQSRLAYVSCVRQLEVVKNSDYCEYIRPPIDRYATLQFGSYDEIVSHVPVMTYFTDLAEQVSKIEKPKSKFYLNDDSEEEVIDENEEYEDTGAMMEGYEDDDEFAHSDGDDAASEDGEDQTSERRKVKSIISPLYKLGLISKVHIEEPYHVELGQAHLLQKNLVSPEHSSMHASDSVSTSVDSWYSSRSVRSRTKETKESFEHGEVDVGRTQKPSLTKEQIEALANDDRFQGSLTLSSSWKDAAKEKQFSVPAGEPVKEGLDLVASVAENTLGTVLMGHGLEMLPSATENAGKKLRSISRDKTAGSSHESFRSKVQEGLDETVGKTNPDLKLCLGEGVVTAEVCQEEMKATVIACEQTQNQSDVNHFGDGQRKIKQQVEASDLHHGKSRKELLVQREHKIGHRLTDVGSVKTVSPQREAQPACIDPAEMKGRVKDFPSADKSVPGCPVDAKGITLIEDGVKMQAYDQVEDTRAKIKEPHMSGQSWSFQEVLHSTLEEMCVSSWCDKLPENMKILHDGKSAGLQNSSAYLEVCQPHVQTGPEIYCPDELTVDHLRNSPTAQLGSIPKPDFTVCQRAAGQAIFSDLVKMLLEESGHCLKEAEKQEKAAFPLVGNQGPIDESQALDFLLGKTYVAMSQNKGFELELANSGAGMNSTLEAKADKEKAEERTKKKVSFGDSIGCPEVADRFIECTAEHVRTLQCETEMVSQHVKPYLGTEQLPESQSATKEAVVEGLKAEIQNVKNSGLVKKLLGQSSVGVDPDLAEDHEPSPMYNYQKQSPETKGSREQDSVLTVLRFSQSEKVTFRKDNKEVMYNRNIGDQDQVEKERTEEIVNQTQENASLSNHPLLVSMSQPRECQHREAAQPSPRQKVEKKASSHLDSQLLPHLPGDSVIQVTNETGDLSQPADHSEAEEENITGLRKEFIIEFSKKTGKKETVKIFFTPSGSTPDNSEEELEEGDDNEELEEEAEDPGAAVSLIESLRRKEEAKGSADISPFMEFVKGRKNYEEENLKSENLSKALKIAAFMKRMENREQSLKAKKQDAVAASKPQWINKSPRKNPDGVKKKAGPGGSPKGIKKAARQRGFYSPSRGGDFPSYERRSERGSQVKNTKSWSSLQEEEEEEEEEYTLFQSPKASAYTTTHASKQQHLQDDVVKVSDMEEPHSKFLTSRKRSKSFDPIKRSGNNTDNLPGGLGKKFSLTSEGVDFKYIQKRHDSDGCERLTKQSPFQEEKLVKRRRILQAPPHAQRKAQESCEEDMVFALERASYYEKNKKKSPKQQGTPEYKSPKKKTKMTPENIVITTMSKKLNEQNKNKLRTKKKESLNRQMSPPSGKTKESIKSVSSRSSVKKVTNESQNDRHKPIATRSPKQEKNCNELTETPSTKGQGSAKWPPKHEKNNEELTETPASKGQASARWPVKHEKNYDEMIDSLPTKGLTSAKWPPQHEKNTDEMIETSPTKVQALATRLPKHEKNTDEVIETSPTKMDMSANYEKNTDELSTNVQASATKPPKQARNFDEVTETVPIQVCESNPQEIVKSLPTQVQVSASLYKEIEEFKQLFPADDLTKALQAGQYRPSESEEMMLQALQNITIRTVPIASLDHLEDRISSCTLCCESMSDLISSSEGSSSSYRSSAAKEGCHSSSSGNCDLHRCEFGSHCNSECVQGENHQNTSSQCSSVEFATCSSVGHVRILEHPFPCSSTPHVHDHNCSDNNDRDRLQQWQQEKLPAKGILKNKGDVTGNTDHCLSL